MSITCEELEALLPELLDGNAGPGDEEAAATHLATCRHCRLVVDETNEVRRIAREHGPMLLPAESRHRILRALEDEEV
jgi:predicted anti-sigma-YlaC factor YlaD